MTIKNVLLINLAATLAMSGVIWLVQLLHYPLFAQVGESNWPAYSISHMNRITLLVLPLMFIEAISALWLVFTPPFHVSRALLVVALILVGITWFMTVFVHTGQHQLLSLRFDVSTHSALVSSNWIRTIAWTLRSALMLWITANLLERSLSAYGRE